MREFYKGNLCCLLYTQLCKHDGVSSIHHQKNLYKIVYTYMCTCAYEVILKNWLPGTML